MDENEREYLEHIEKWDRRYLALAEQVASWSKDPSTKCGAVIVDSDNLLVSVGYNGFAPYVIDDEDRYANRELKYDLVIHCEENAMLCADRHRLKGATLYTVPFLTCSRCAAKVIRTGIMRVVAPRLIKEQWRTSFERAKMQYAEAHVEVSLYD